jgi:hypothetical protein
MPSSTLWIVVLNEDATRNDRVAWDRHKGGSAESGNRMRVDRHRGQDFIELRSISRERQNPQIPKFFIFGIVTVEEKGNHIIPFKPQQSHGDDGWWSG